ncbi:MAG: hypothetical protein JNM55_09495 [Anaerolineales bacterium]|nr:hypothetical protein [Anaerolineales bacterium]
MEIILAIVVASAVIFFGALISMGNERQRKAIDGLREQVILWAVQDLKIKREHLARTAQVPDPLSWLNKTASKILGNDLKLLIIETFDEPRSLVCASGDSSVKIIFSPFSPADIRRMKSGKQNPLSQFASQNPLFSLPRGTDVHEISVLNGGFLFDLELPLAWTRLTGQEVSHMEQIWVYVSS